jgi:hypothetical protein
MAGSLKLFDTHNGYVLGTAWSRVQTHSGEYHVFAVPRKKFVGSFLCVVVVLYALLLQPLERGMFTTRPTHAPSTPSAPPVSAEPLLFLAQLALQAATHGADLSPTKERSK